MPNPRNHLFSSPNNNSFSTKSHPTFFISNWTRILIWSIFFIFFSAVTIIELLPLFASYHYDNTATKISVVKTNTIPRPKVTVCLSYHSGSLDNIVDWIGHDNSSNRSGPSCLECDGLRDHSWDVWSTTDMNNAGELAAALLKKLLENPTPSSLLVLNTSNFNWNQPLVDAVWRMFACISYRDIKTAIHNWSSRTVQFCEGLNMSDFESVPKDVIDQLYWGVLQAVDTYFKISCTFPASDDAPVKGRGTSLQNLEDRGTSLTIKGEHFCFSMLQNTTEEKFSFKQYPDGDSPPWFRPHRPDRFLVFEDDSGLYAYTGLYFQPLYSSAGDGESINHYEYVTLPYAVDSQVIDTRSASNTCRDTRESTVACLAQKFHEFALEHCGCIPFTYRHLITNPTIDFPYCTLNHYRKCRDDWNDQLDDHKTECTNKCEHVFYIWKPYRHPFKKIDPAKIIVRVRIEALPDPFIKFTVTVKDSLEQFVAQIGGVVNLYLGYSAMSVCGLVIIFVDWIVERYRSKEEHPAKNGQGTGERQEPKLGSAVFTQEAALKYINDQVGLSMINVEKKLLQVIEKRIGSKM